MRRFHDMSIKQKLTILMVATATLVLVIACGSFMAYEYSAIPRSVAKQLSAVAAVTGNNSAAALVFDDAFAAKETLAAFKSTPNVVWAYIYRKDGRVFAGYDRDGTMAVAPQCPMVFEGHRANGDRIELCRQIRLRGEVIGAISVSSDLSEMRSRMWSYGKIVVVVLGFSILIAYCLAKLLQNVVSGPIHTLARLARKISADQDYTVRARKQGSDEIGELVDGFNRMLGQIESRELALRIAQGELEERVVELQREVGERKRTEVRLARRSAALQRSNAELEQFAYVASHDMQEPLRMVSSYTQLLAKRYGDKLDGNAREYIDYAVDGVMRMQSLIRDLLQFSRVGRKDQAFDSVSCESLLQTSLLNLAATVRENNAVVTHDSLPIVLGDEMQLSQLFQNLIANAIKYRGEVAPRVHIGCRRGSGEWLFTVKDNGIGIDPEYFDRIFVLFQRLHGKDAYEGTGIGLALCKKIVERHGGKIWVESAVGEGSTFYFTLHRSDSANVQTGVQL